MEKDIKLERPKMGPEEKEEYDDSGEAFETDIDRLYSNDEEPTEEEED